MPIFTPGFEQTVSWFPPQWPLDLYTPQAGVDAELVRQLAFLPGLKELLMLRQVHALEHATVWVLSEVWRQRGRSSGLSDEASLAGLSTPTGFYLYGPIQHIELGRAVQTARHRITKGEWQLAVHPRCGTNVSVGVFLAASLFAGMQWLLPRGPIEQFLGLGVAMTAAVQLAPDLGGIMQQYVTTAIPFNLAIENILSVAPETLETPVYQTLLGERKPQAPIYFIQVSWMEQQ